MTSPATAGTPAPGGGAGPAPAGPPGPVALSVNGLTWRVGGIPIVDGVDLALGEAEFVAVIGPNGAGKTSLFNLVSGLVRPTSGSVWLGGRDVTGMPPYRRARHGLGRTFQSSSVFGSLSVLDNMRLAVQAHLGGSMSMVRRTATDAEVTRRARLVLDRVLLAGRAGVPAGALSHGDKRKVEIGLLLASEPGVLLLDEPMAGVSAEDVPALVDVIGGLTDGGHSVLMVEHHMDVVLGLAHRVAVMHHGALLICDTPVAVMADATVQEAYLGEAL